VTQLHDLTALDQGAAIASGEVSSVELVEHYLERAERLNGSLGAFVTFSAEQARERAASYSAAIGVGPLAGVPTAIKDLNATAGVRTMFGSVLLADYVPEVSDEVVSRIEAAGLISLGKTNTPEFGSPCYTESAIRLTSHGVTAGGAMADSV
jgi:amidase